MKSNNGIPYFINCCHSGTNGASGSTSINNDLWHHVVGVRDGNQMSIYVDGNRVGQRTGTSSWNFSSSHPLYIGKEIQEEDSFSYNGLIDDVRIYNRALSESEIQDLFDLGNINDPPTDITLSNNSINENEPPGMLVGLLSTADLDVDDSHTYSLVSGDGDADNGWFTISGNEILTAASFDRETCSSYSIRIQTVDQNSSIFEKIFTIAVSNVNEPPMAQSASFTLSEHTANNTPVGSIAALDPDAADSLTFSISDGNADGVFAINSSSGEIFVADNSTLDFETTQSYELTVVVTDLSGLSADAAVTVNVIDVNDMPLIKGQVAVSTIEETAIAITLADLSVTDQDNFYPVGFTLTVGDGDNYSHTGNTITPNPNFNGTLTVPVVVDDGESANSTSAVFDLSVTVTAVNDVPVVGDIADQSIAEGSSFATINLDDYVNDIDNPDAEIAWTASGNSDLMVTIDAGRMAFITIPNEDWNGSETIIFRATDTGVLYAEDAAIFTVTAVNDAPVIVSTAQTIAIEDVLYSYEVIVADSDDANNGIDLIFSLTNAPTGMTISNTGLIEWTPLEGVAGSGQVTVTVTDGGEDGATAASQNFTLAVTPVNDAPTDITLSNISIDENLPSGTLVGTLTSADADADDSHTYSLVPVGIDDDWTHFTIAGNELRSSSIFDYELVNSYSLLVRTEDSSGEFFEKLLTIIVNNLNNEAPLGVTLSKSSILENQPVGSIVGTFSTTDQDIGQIHLYSLADGLGDDDNALFTISDDELRTVASFDFETRSSYEIRVKTEDQHGGAFEETFTIAVVDANDPPTDIALSSSVVAENQDAGSIVGTLTTLDQDTTDRHIYSLVTGDADADNGLFTISGNEIHTAASFDRETRSSYSIRIQTVDQNSSIFEKLFTIAVSNVNEPPMAQSASFTLSEHTANNTPVGSIAALDPDAGDSLTFSITTGNADGVFAINSGSGEITVADNSALDFETTLSYVLTVVVADLGGLSADAVITVNVIDVNDMPLIKGQIAVNTLEETTITITLADLVVTDPDNDNTYPLGFTLTVGGGLNYSRSGNTITPNTDFNGTLTVPVSVDDGEAENSTSALFDCSVTVTAVNDAPVIFSTAPTSATEDELYSYQVVVADPDDTNSGTDLTFSLTNEPIGMTISNTGLIEWTPLEGVGNSGEVTVTVADGGEDGAVADSENFTLSVTAVNDPPTDITLSNNSIDENRLAGTLVGTFSAVDPDVDDSHTYFLSSLGGGDFDWIFFTIDGNELRTRVPFDYEFLTSYSFLVITEDQSGDIFEKAFTIDVNDLPNEAPLGITLSNSEVSENQDAGKTVGTFSTTDQDIGQDHLYSLTAGVGDDDNAFFTISNDELKTAASFDFETKSTYEIRVRTDDQHAGAFEEKFMISVIDINDAPVADDQSLSLDENTTAAITLTGSDVDGDLLSYSVVADPAYGTLEGSAPDLTYTPNSGWFGTDTFTFKVNDGAVDSNLATVFITVTEALADTAVRVSADNYSPDYGEQVIISVTVKNHGHRPTDGVRARIVLPDGLSYISDDSGGSYDPFSGIWDIGPLAPEAPGNEVVLAITAAVLRTGRESAMAGITESEVRDPKKGNNSAALFLNQHSQADLAIEQLVDKPTPLSGEAVTRTIRINNNGVNDATGIRVTALPSDLVYDSHTTSQGVYDQYSGEWQVGGLPIGASAELAITSAIPNTDEIDSITEISHMDQVDPDRTNNTACTVINPAQDIRADLAIDTFANRNAVLLGDETVITVVVRNNGPEAAGNVVVEDLLPAGLSFQKALPSQGNYDNVSGEWTVGTLPADDFAHLEILATIESDSVSNQASVAALDEHDPCRNNDTAMAQVVVDNVPPLQAADQHIQVMNDQSILFNWTPSISSDAAFYNIYWDEGTGIMNYDTPLSSLDHPASFFQTAPLADGTYHFVIRVADILGNEETSAYVLSGLVDTTPPAAVSNFGYDLITGNIVKLSWLPPMENDIEYFQIYSDHGTGSINTDNPIAVVERETYAWTSDALTLANYIFSIVAVDSSGNRLDALTTIQNVELSFPDLSVFAAEWNPVEIKFGEDVTFKAQITNNGSEVTTKGFFIAYYCDDIMIGYQYHKDPLPPGESVEVVKDWRSNIVSKSYTLSVVVDAIENRVIESNEENNTYYGNITILPDYIISAGTARPSYVAGETSKVLVTVADSTAPTNYYSETQVDVSITVKNENGDMVRPQSDMLFDDSPGSNMFTTQIDTTGFETGVYVATISASGIGGTKTASCNVKIVDDFSINVQTSKAVYYPGESIDIAGRVTTNDGTQLSDVSVTIVLEARGFKRQITTKTDSQGDYLYTFKPLQGEGGFYNVTATVSVNDLPRSDATDFTIEGLFIAPAGVNVDMSKNTSVQGTVKVINIGTEAVYGLNIFLDDPDADDSVTVAITNSSLPDTLDAGETISIDIEIDSDLDAPDNAEIVLITSGTGIPDRQISIKAALHEPTPSPVITPSSFSLGVHPGELITQEIVYKNGGYGNLNDVVVDIPELEWMTTIEAEIGSLAPSEAKTFAIWVKPPEDIQLGIYQTQIIVRTDEGQFPLNATIDVNSSEVGSIGFKVGNDTGYPVSGATVTLVSDEEYTMETISGSKSYKHIVSQKTDSSGIATFTDVPRGVYDYQIDAKDHDSAVGEADIRSGDSNEALEVDLVKNLVHVEWTVTPTDITDRYTIDLVLTFETDTPKPVLLLSPSWLEFSMDYGEVVDGQLSVTNPSLIDINNIVIDATQLDGIDLYFDSPEGPTKTITIEKLKPVETQDGTILLPYKAWLKDGASMQTRDLGSIIGEGEYIYFTQGADTSEPKVSKTTAVTKVKYIWYDPVRKLRISPRSIHFTEYCDGLVSAPVLDDVTYRKATVYNQGEEDVQLGDAIGFTIKVSLLDAIKKLVTLGADLVIPTTEISATPGISSIWAGSFEDGQLSPQENTELIMTELKTTIVGLDLPDIGARIGMVAFGGLWETAPLPSVYAIPVFITTICNSGISIPVGSGGAGSGGGGDGGGYDSSGWYGYWPGGGGSGGYSTPGWTSISLTEDPPPPTVHEVVKLKISQEAALEREAFDASMEITPLVDNLEDVQARLIIKNDSGEESNDMFQYQINSLSGIDSLAGDDIIYTGGSAKIDWIIVPKASAGGTDMNGTNFNVGAKLFFTVAGKSYEYETEFVPIIITAVRLTFLETL